MRTANLLSTLFSLAVVVGAVVPAHAAPSNAVAADSRFGVAEGYRNPGVMADIGAGWERLILPWDQIQPDGPADFGHLGITISSDQLQSELNRGERVVGLLEFTPEWAAENPESGK